MAYDPEKHHRCSIRLKGYDYAQAGAYFVTLVTQDRDCLFGGVANGKMRLNECGEIVNEAWKWLFRRYEYVDSDVSIVMPNHFHGIIVIHDTPGRGGSRTAPTTDAAHEPSERPGRKPLGRLVGVFKTVSTKHINLRRNRPVGAVREPPLLVWQRNYYEHIIRNERSLNHIREYILKNPLQWEFDRENPLRLTSQTTKVLAPWEA